MTHPRHIPRAPAADGFSLIELVAVLVLITLTMAIATPSLSDFAANRRLHDTAGSMLVLIQTARTLAISEGRPYRFHVDTAARRYYLTAQDGGAFVPLGTELGRRYEIAEHLAVEWSDPAMAQVGYVQVSPTGEIDPATLRIVGRNAAELRLTSATPTEKYRIVNPLDEPESDTSYANASIKNTNTNRTTSKANSKNMGSSGGGVEGRGASR